MFSIVYFACLLAAFSAAAPQIGMAGITQQQSQQTSVQSTSVSGASGMGGIGGIGGVGGGSSFSSVTTSSRSSTSFLSSFSDIESFIGQMQAQCDQGVMTQQLAMQQMSRLARSFQTALTQGAGCGGGCFGPGFSVVNQVFMRLTQVMSYMQTTFGGAFHQICGPFAPIAPEFYSFFQMCAQFGLSLNQLIPNMMPSLMGQVIPQFGQSINQLGFK